MSKPILLKRGLANTIDELLMSAEYIMASGNENVILCERGIRTFETRTRNTLDLSAIPVLKKLTHLPIVVDPSHAMGYAHLVKPMAMAATGIRYILTERGLRTANEDIAYGQCIYPCDFDGNGREDYWLVQENESRKGQLYLAAEESK